MGDWYYIGHYGQLGPLTLEQIAELVEGDVIAPETYVWKVGMSEWVSAGNVFELASLFNSRQRMTSPPPPPGAMSAPPAAPVSYPAQTSYAPVYANYQRTLVTLKSDKSRAVAGILQMVLPGVGRMYLGYIAYGILQMFFSLLCVGWLWSFIEGIYILAGGVKFDGYGRSLGE